MYSFYLGIVVAASGEESCHVWLSVVGEFFMFPKVQWAQFTRIPSSNPGGR